MVEWLEVARGLAIDLLKLVLFWYAENQRGAGLKNKAGIDTVSGKEQSGVWLQQLARSIFCEQEKEAVVIDLKDCQSRFGWASFFSGFITGILFACFACFAAWAGYRILFRAERVTGQPVEFVGQPLKAVNFDLLDHADSDSSDEVVAARLRARALRG